MKKFAGNKPLDTIKSEVIKNGWPWDQTHFDASGSDYVSFGFDHMGYRLDVTYNTFNGKFIAKPHFALSGELVTENSKLDGVPWFDALLDFIYTPLECADRVASEVGA